jgi:hypothetical protein
VGPATGHVVLGGVAESEIHSCALQYAAGGVPAAGAGPVGSQAAPISVPPCINQYYPMFFWHVLQYAGGDVPAAGFGPVSCQGGSDNAALCIASSQPPSFCLPCCIRRRWCPCSRSWTIWHPRWLSGAYHVIWYHVMVPVQAVPALFKSV